MRFAPCILAAALVVLLTSPVGAQQNQQPANQQNRQQQNQQQQNQQQQQQPQSPFGTPLHQNPDIRKSLNLTDQQIQRLNEANQRWQTQIQDELGRVEKLDERQRTARMQELQQNYWTDPMKSAATILSEPQATRYRQLGLQSRGLEAFSDPDVQKGLSLNDDQRQQLQAASARYTQMMRDIDLAAKTDRNDAVKMWDEAQRIRHDQVQSILDGSQRRPWAGMIGEPYEFRPDYLPRRP